MANIVDTACRYAWTYPIIDLGRAELRNCCRTPFNTINDSDWAMGTGIFKNLEAIKQVKRDLLNGVKTIKCNTCWKSEEVGIKSARSGIEDFSHFLKAVIWHDLTIDEIKNKLLNLTDSDIEELVNLEHPEHVELSLSTVCDLKCIYCNHVFSTQWATEKLKYGEITIAELPKNDNDTYEKIWWRWFEDVASNTVHKVTFVGGEPLINENFYLYVDKLINYYEFVKKKPIHIFVATNFNTPKKYLDKFFDTIKRISTSNYISIGIGLSFESTEKKNEFIRTNSDWNLFKSNIYKLIDTINGVKRYKKINVIIMPAINALSVSDLPNFCNLIIDMRSKLVNPIRISSTHVTWPIRYSPFILTPDFIPYIDSGIQIIKNSKWFNDWPKSENGSWIAFGDYLETMKTSIISIDNSDAHIISARKEFVEDIDKLCTRRNLNFESTFPELVEFYNFCKKF